MMTNPIGRLSANNAAYNWMGAANSLTNLCSFSGSSTCNPASLLSSEKNLAAQMLNDSFQYQAYSAMADSQEKLQKENIKRSFSTFA